MSTAGLTWPEATVAITGVLAIAAVLSVIIWQVFETGRSDVRARRKNAAE